MSYLLICPAELRGDVRGEWDELKQHDVVFLVTVRPPDAVRLAEVRAQSIELSPADTYGLVYVRGAEVIEVCPTESAGLTSHILCYIMSISRGYVRAVDPCHDRHKTYAANCSICPVL